MQIACYYKTLRNGALAPTERSQADSIGKRESGSFLAIFLLASQARSSANRMACRF
jgi:hypothetical protein